MPQEKIKLQQKVRYAKKKITQEVIEKKVKSTRVTAVGNFPYSDEFLIALLFFTIFNRCNRLVATRHTTMMKAILDEFPQRIIDLSGLELDKAGWIKRPTLAQLNNKFRTKNKSCKR
jgi:hypothetical protein